MQLVKINVSRTNAFTQKEVEYSIEINRDLVDAKYVEIQNEFPDDSLHFLYDGTASFISGPAKNQMVDEQNVRDGKMTWDELDAKWGL